MKKFLLIALFAFVALGLSAQTSTSFKNEVNTAVQQAETKASEIDLLIAELSKSLMTTEQRTEFDAIKNEIRVARVKIVNLEPQFRQAKKELKTGILNDIKSAKGEYDAALQKLKSFAAKL